MRLFQYVAEFVYNIKRIFMAFGYDVVVVQKGLISTSIRGFDVFLGWINPCLVFDLDDAIYGRSIVEFSSKFLRVFQDSDQTKRISAMSRAVIAGNTHLKKMASQYNLNVFLIPTPVDTRRFVPCPGKAREEVKKIVIGWIGTYDGLETHVRLLEGVFQELSNRYPVQFMLVTRPGKVPFRFDGVDMKLVPWSYESEVVLMSEFDIGLMPLRDTPWVQGKCGLKILQYMAMGIPSVSERLGANCDIVNDGVDGFLAWGKTEWVEKISRLIENPQLRKSMGELGRKKVVEHYSLDIMTPLLINVLRSVSRTRSVSAS